MSEHIPNLPDSALEEMKASWLKLAEQKPEEKIIIPSKKLEDKPLHLIVKREIRSDERQRNKKVSYLVFLDRTVEDQKDIDLGYPSDREIDRDKIGYFSCSNISRFGKMIMSGVEIYNPEFRQRGIGTAMYDLIEKDLRSIGGTGIDPDIGALSPDAVAFWQKRRPEEGDQIAAANAAMQDEGDSTE